MTKKTKKPEYAVAMSKETGCIVMCRTNGTQVTVMGAMDREQSLEFVRSIMEWSEQVIREDAPRIQQIN